MVFHKAHFRWIFILLLLLVGGVLVACSPSVSPTEPVTSVQTAVAVETVVVTEIVEGEPVEVVVTATPEPTQPPLSTSTPGPSPTPRLVTIEVSPTALDIEDRRVEVEWPVSMAPSDSTTVRLAFVPVEGGFAVVTEFPDNQLQVTEVAVKQMSDFELSAIANLDSVGFTVSPTGQQPKLVTIGEPLTWHWTITPKQTGEHHLSLSLTLHWEPLTEGVQPRESVVYSKGLPVQVVSSSNFGIGMGTMGMVCTLSLLGVGGLGMWMIGRGRPRVNARGVPKVNGVASISEISFGEDTSSKIVIEPPPGIELTKPEIMLLSNLFARYARLVLEREFLSGYSGARTFLALPVRPDSRVDAHTIVKIADARSVQREYENYENFVKTTLPPATARIQQPPVRLKNLAALQYTFLGSSGYMPTSLRQALLERPDPRLLWKLFDTFAPNWWMQHKPYVFRLGQEYDRKLPTHYVLEPTTATSDALLDGQRPPASAGELIPGMILALKNFPHTELRSDGQSLSLMSDPLPGYAPIRVRWTAPALGNNPVGRLLNTRWTLLQDTCSGFNRFDLPDPLVNLPALLGERVNGTQSLIHGDLNVENILVGPSDWVWLIDFAETRDGHTLYDFAHLYAELIAHVVAPQIPHPPDFLEILRDGADPLLATVQKMAGRCMFDPKHTREFELAVIISCLGALKFANLTSHARHLLYLTAASLTPPAVSKAP